jgi:RNA 2'-phosphotransferase, Tpt1 / KptA family
VHVTSKDGWTAIQVQLHTVHPPLSIDISAMVICPCLQACVTPWAERCEAVVKFDMSLLSMQADGVLRRMSRTHIHFATAAGHLRRNSWVAVALQLDLPAALAAGHTFFRAANGVLLTEGPLPVSFVRQVAPEDIEWDSAVLQWPMSDIQGMPQQKFASSWDASD